MGRRRMWCVEFARGGGRPEFRVFESEPAARNFVASSAAGCSRCHVWEL